MRPSFGSRHRAAPVPVRPVSAFGDGQREFFRIAIEIPVAFRNGEGQHCAARLRNLSPAGLQICCNFSTAQIIYPLGGIVPTHNQPILHATTILPLSTGAETLSVGVRLLYSTILNHEPRCVLGFRFLELRPKARRLVETFFAEQIRELDPAAVDSGRAA
jgi:PilZ domain